MAYVTPRLTYREVVAAALRLVVHAIDHDVGVVAIEKCTDRPVPHEKHVPFVTPIEYGFRFAHNTFLGVSGAFPSANALVWMSKEFVGYGLEFLGWKKAGRRAIILVHRVANFDR